MVEALLTVRNLRYGTPEGSPLVQNLNFTLKAGEAVIISGRNGTGKSTLFRALLGMHPIEHGEIKVNIRDKEVAYLPQIQNKFCHLPFTLLDVIEFSLGKQVNTQEILALKLIEKKHLHLAWNKASGGERQRTMLTRLFLQRPRLLLLDEPTNHLDRSAHKHLSELMNHYIATNPEAAFAIVSHDPEFNSLPGVQRLNLDEFRVEGSAHA